MSNFKDLAKITFMDTKYSHGAQDGKRAMVKFGIAIKRKFKDRNGEFKYDMFNCVAWDKVAEYIMNNMAAKDRILIEGTLQQNQYEKDGKTMSDYQIYVDQVQAVDFKRDGAQKPAQIQQAESFDNPFDL